VSGVTIVWLWILPSTNTHNDLVNQSFPWKWKLYAHYDYKWSKSDKLCILRSDLTFHLENNDFSFWNGYMLWTFDDFCSVGSFVKRKFIDLEMSSNDRAFLMKLINPDFHGKYFLKDERYIRKLSFTWPEYSIWKSSFDSRSWIFFIKK